MPSIDIKLRRLRESDLPACLQLTQAERWPHRHHDWQLHYDVGEGWVAVHDEDIVGVTMRWLYSNHIATIGLVVVSQSQQGRGIGGRLMRAAMDGMDAYTLRLMATDAGLKLYENCGFVAVGQITQIQGEIKVAPAAVAADGVTIRRVTRRDLDRFVEVDSEAYGGARCDLLSAILRDDRGVVAERGNQIRGFALIRDSGHGQTVGPVIAKDQSVAISMVSELLTTESGFVRLDIDLEATQFVQWLENIGLTSIDTVTIMIRPEERSTDKQYRTYGLVSQAFG